MGEINKKLYGPIEVVNKLITISASYSAIIKIVGYEVNPATIVHAMREIMKQEVEFVNTYKLFRNDLEKVLVRMEIEYDENIPPEARTDIEKDFHNLFIDFLYNIIKLKE